MNSWKDSPNWGDRFDWWREHYTTLSNTEQKEFHGAVAEAFPNQKCYSPKIFEWLETPSGERYRKMGILEVGGWKGGLARECLTRYPDIPAWVNIEFAPVSPDIKGDHRYTHETPPSFRWWKWSDRAPHEREFGIVVMTHVLEHLTWRDARELLNALIEACTSPILYLEAPLKESGDWMGYGGTHISDYGWGVLTDMLIPAGYNHYHVWLGDDIRVYVHDTKLNSIVMTNE